MSAAEVEALAKRCETASGFDRQLNGDIAFAMGLYARAPVVATPPNYTESIDAAMTLVPEGCLADTQQRYRMHNPPAEYVDKAWAKIESVDGGRVLAVAVASTVPLALCAAALRSSR